MNVGRTAQMNQVPGTGVGVGVGGADGLPQHQPMQEMAALSGSDQQFLMLRTAMREKIFEYIGRKQTSDEWQKRLPELAKRLEEILYRKFPNKNDYYNMMKGPVEPQLQFAIRTLSALNQHNQQNPQMTRQIASSFGYGTMIPTPGMTQGTCASSRIPYVTDNDALSSFGGGMVPQNANMGASMQGDTMELDGGATGRSHAGGGGGSLAGDLDDRLSALPDSLLHTIMSFLKARQAVQTCVLATRWRHLWRSVPCLDVDQDEFRTVPKPSNNHPVPNVDNSDIEFDEDDSDGNEDDDKDSEWDSFEDFADCLMHHCNIARLDSLRLHVSKSRAPSFANKQAGGWLRRAMKYCTPDPPRQREGQGSNSWCLRKLYLCNVALDCRFTQHVSSVCRSLEDLELEDCLCAIHLITSSSLKSLVLKNCRWNVLYEIACPTLKSLAISGGSNSSDCVLVIRAPAIAHLCLDVPLRFAKRVAVN